VPASQAEEQKHTQQPDNCASSCRLVDDGEVPRGPNRRPGTRLPKLPIGSDTPGSKLPVALSSLSGAQRSRRICSCFRCFQVGGDPPASTLSHTVIRSAAQRSRRICSCFSSCPSWRSSSGIEKLCNRARLQSCRNAHPTRWALAPEGCLGVISESAVIQPLRTSLSRCHP